MKRDNVTFDLPHDEHVRDFRMFVADTAARRRLGQTLIEQGDVGCEPCYAATRKPLQHGIFQQPGGILGCDLLGAELAAKRRVRSSSPFADRQ